MVEDTRQEIVADSSDNGSDPHSDPDSGYKDSNESPAQTVPVEQDWNFDNSNVLKQWILIVVSHYNIIFLCT